MYNNPDQGADYELICNVMDEKLSPIFELVGNELKELREQVNELRDLNYKLISGFGEAVDTNRRKTYGEKLGAYGEDLEPLDEFHQTTFGKSFRDDLLDKLINGENGESDFDEFVKNSIGSAKEKYGKFLPQRVATTEIEVAAPEGEKEPEVEIAVEAEKPKDAVNEMISRLTGKK